MKAIEKLLTKAEKDEVYTELMLAEEHTDKGTSLFAGMTYEEGVANAIMWLLGNTDDKPMTGL